MRKSPMSYYKQRGSVAANLGEPTLTRLKELSKRRGNQSLASLIRNAVLEMLSREETPPAA
jgi:hypothetical protein